MDYASFKKRIIAGIIDYIIIFFILYIIGGGIILFIWKGDINMQMAPFVVMSIILIPLEFLIKLFKFPGTYGDATVYCLLLGIFYFLEVAYYSLLEMSSLKNTIGHRCMKISVRAMDNKSINTLSIISRNCLKTISRYLFLIPLLSILLTKRKQAFYDMICNTIVVSEQKK